MQYTHPDLRLEVFEDTKRTGFIRNGNYYYCTVYLTLYEKETNEEFCKTNFLNEDLGYLYAYKWLERITKDYESWR